MINKISVSVDKNKKYTPATNQHNSQPAFKGSDLGEWVLKGVQACEREPMVNVTVLDLATAILPRTFFETFIGSKKKDENGKETNERKLNIMGGFEAFRRESSGLIINCIAPSFIVWGAAKLLNKPVMGDFNKSNLTKCWANSDALNKIEKYFKASTGDNLEDRVYNTLKSMFDDIEGVNGDVSKDGLKKFKEIFANDKEYEETLRNVAKNIVSDSPKKDVTKKAFETLVKKTGISENIRFADDKGYFSNNLKSLLESSSDVLHGVAKEGIEKDADRLTKFFSKSKKLVNAKSAAGLAVIIPLAIAAQPINRWITHKLSGKKGAPLYNDGKERVLTKEEKRKLTAQKFFAVPLMAGVAGLSMLMDRPSLKMFQFKNIFPTMDQARIISAATFSSRIAASEDSNELKENTIRDIATFSSFYFLGDYAAKGIATLLEYLNKDKGVQLINRLKKQDPDANIFKRFWNWAKHTTMKSTDELEAIADKALRTKHKNLRSICQLGNIAFSLISLGVFIPLYTRTQTNKKELAKRKALNEQAAASASVSSTGAAFGSGQSPLLKSQSFKAFLNS